MLPHLYIHFIKCRPYKAMVVFPRIVIMLEIREQGLVCSNKIYFQVHLSLLIEFNLSCLFVNFNWQKRTTD